MTGSREVLIVVRRGDEFLVLFRSQAEGAFWHTVSGTVEAGEDPRATAIRELQEETGLVVADLAELPGLAFEYVREAWEDEAGLRVPVRVFVTHAEAGWEPMLNAEHDEYRWCTREQAVELLFWPEPRRIVASL